MKMAKCIVELERIYGIKNGGKGSNQYVQHSNNFKAAPTQDELAEEIGVTRQQLYNYKELLNLIPELQDLVEKNKVKPTVAYKILAKLPQDEQENS